MMHFNHRCAITFGRTFSQKKPVSRNNHGNILRKARKCVLAPGGFLDRAHTHVKFVHSIAEIPFIFILAPVRNH